MRLLPSEKEKAINETIIKLNEMTNGDIISMYEPCDCGSHIQHNDGGNYHDIVKITKDSDKLFSKEDTTCELTPAAEWCEITQEKAIELIKECGDWL